MHTFNENDLLKFKDWLKNLAVPCTSCNYTYKVQDKTIELVKLSDEEHYNLTGTTFRLETHDIIACSNPKCSACFSYPESAFNKLYFDMLNDEQSNLNEGGTNKDTLEPRANLVM